MLTSLRQKSNIDPGLVDDVCVGNVLSPAFGYGARSAVLAAGFPASTAASVVNRFCSSGLLSIQQIANSISSGAIDIGIAAGVESMSTNPDEVPKLSEKVMQHPIAKDNAMSMGWTSENVARDFGISREQQDDYALLSHTRAAKAQAEGWTWDEIAPVLASWKDPKTGAVSSVVANADGGVRLGTTIESLSKIRPAFPQWPPSTTTGGNASQVTDGAAALLMMKRHTAESLGQEILGKFVMSTVVGLEPRIMGIGPSLAIPKVLERVGLTASDVDLFEINEAFSSMVRSVRLVSSRPNLSIVRLLCTKAGPRHRKGQCQRWCHVSITPKIRSGADFSVVHWDIHSDVQASVKLSLLSLSSKGKRRKWQSHQCVLEQ